MTLIVPLLVMLGNSAVLAGGDAGRESPFAFGAGGRGMGMGRAFVAMPGDPSSAFWNPAATALLDRAEFMAFHTTLFLDTRYSSLALSYPLDILGVFSVSAGLLGTDNIDQRDVYNIRTGTFSSYESQFGLSYARPLAHGFTGGLTLKSASQRVGAASGTGYGADLGFQYHPRFIRNLTVGLCFNDLIRPGIKLEKAEDRYQTRSRFGAAYSREFNGMVSSLASFELESSDGRSAALHAGLEMQFYRQFFLRAGLDKSRISFGAGMAYNSMKLDYAFENVQYLGGSHRISFAIAFGKSLEKSRLQTRAEILEQEKGNWLNSLESERRSQSERLIHAADSLLKLEKYQDALVHYQRAVILDTTSTRAGVMSDSVIVLIMNQAVNAAGDQKRKDLIAGQMGSAMKDFQNGLYNEAISKLNLLLEIDPGNKSVADILDTAGETRRKEISDRANVARSLRNEGNYAGAVAEWNKVLALDRNNADAIRSIDELNDQIDADRLISEAVGAMKDRRYNDAVSRLNQAEKVRPDDRTIQSLMVEARSKSAPATSLEDIKSSSLNWEKYLSGLQSYQSGDYSGALRIWEELRKAYPNNLELDNNIDQARQRLAAEGGR